MSIPIVIKRNYRTDDASMLQNCATVLGQYTAHRAAFTSFDAMYDATYGTAFSDSIDAARNYISDNILVDVMAQNTMNVEAKMVECRDAYILAKYFVEKAFPTLPGVQNQFGLNDYEEARRSHEKMIQFMTDLHAMLVKYDMELSMVNYPAGGAAAVLLLKNDLERLNTIQELSKGDRTAATNHRVNLLNAAYAIAMQICNAAKIVFNTDYGLYQLFILRWGSDGSTPSQIIENTITGAEVQNIAIPDILPTTELTFTNLGAFDLDFYFAATADATTGNLPTILVAGATEEVAAGNIGFDPAHPFLNVIKPSGASCAYKVEWV